MFRFENITVCYGDKTVLDGFSLDVAQGEKVLIEGASGTGKTTLLRLALGFQQPSSGAVYFNDVRVDETTVWDVRKRVAYINQNSDIGDGVVKDFIAQVGRFKANASFDGAVTDDALRKACLNRAILAKNIADLSGGERQRVALLVALLLKRDVFLLDEVTSDLDAGNAGCIIDLFSHAPWTIIAVAHDTLWRTSGMRVVSLA